MSPLVLLCAANAAAQSFVTAPSYPAGRDPSGIEAADLDGDGLDDLVVVNPGPTDTLTVLLGGSFVPTTLPVGDDPAAVAIGDFDGDGAPDLAAAARGSDEVN